MVYSQQMNLTGSNKGFNKGFDKDFDKGIDKGIEKDFEQGNKRGFFQDPIKDKCRRGLMKLI